MGDANGRGAFTHTSWNDYEIVAANLFDSDPRKISDRIPCYALFIDPPLGRVGMNEDEARKSGRRILAGKMPMTRIGRAREAGETQGFMKVLVDADSKELLGAAILGLNGDEIVHSLLDVMYAAQALHHHPARGAYPSDGDRARADAAWAAEAARARRGNESMTGLVILAALCVTAMGFAIQRGGTCTVAAVDEVLSQRRAHQLAAMFEASLWVAGGLAIAQLLHLAGSMPGGVAIDGWTVAGGVLLGLGAWVNGACVLGAVARLGSGEWAWLTRPRTPATR